MRAGSWEAEYRPFAVEGDRAVAVGETRYPGEGKRYGNTYLLEFAADGALQLVHRVVLPASGES